MEPDDLVPQLRDANIAAGRMGWARYRAEGWEADDAMAAIADAAVAAGFDEVLLLTADHDLLGVVSDRVAVLRPRAGGGVDRYGPSDVEERSPYRVPPALVADVKALIGDATDGYGGVRGIGPSVGPDLVRRFGSLAALYDRIEEVEATGVRNRLLAGREDAFRCLDLATLRRDAPLSPAFDPDAGRVDDVRPRARSRRGSRRWALGTSFASCPRRSGQLAAPLATAIRGPRAWHSPWDPAGRWTDRARLGRSTRTRRAAARAGTPWWARTCRPSCGRTDTS